MIRLINFILFMLVFSNSILTSQELNKFQEGFDKKVILKELSEGACKCIDSIVTFDKSKAKISNEINECIDGIVISYQTIIQLSNINLEIKKSIKDGTEIDENKEQVITINDDKSSQTYKKNYYEIEEYLMENCSALKSKVATNDEMKSYSISDNRDAQIAYTEGIEEMKKDNIRGAAFLFQKAVDIDKEFPFAWDNLGLCHRKLNNFDKAIECYKKSLEIDPFGMTPLQNIAVAYQHKKEFQSAIDAYSKMAMVDDTNPEVYFGLSICFLNMDNYTKSLENMCKAYNIYIKINSPYRVDAQKVIATLYHDYKEKEKLSEFNEILKKYNITIEKE